VQHVFVLCPDSSAAAAWLNEVDRKWPRSARLASRYEDAADAPRLHARVRQAGRRGETTAWRGLVAWIGLGALAFGAVGAGLGVAGWLGGSFAAGAAFGLAIGALVGGLSAAMNGTHVVRPALDGLIGAYRPGNVLLVLDVTEPPVAAELVSALRDRGWRWARWSR